MQTGWVGVAEGPRPEEKALSVESWSPPRVILVDVAEDPEERLLIIRGASSTDQVVAMLLSLSFSSPKSYVLDNKIIGSLIARTL